MARRTRRSRIDAHESVNDAGMTIESIGDTFPKVGHAARPDLDLVGPSGAITLDRA